MATAAQVLRNTSRLYGGQTKPDTVKILFSHSLFSSSSTAAVPQGTTQTPRTQRSLPAMAHPDRLKPQTTLLPHAQRPMAGKCVSKEWKVIRSVSLRVGKDGGGTRAAPYSPLTGESRRPPQAS